MHSLYLLSSCQHTLFRIHFIIPITESRKDPKSSTKGGRASRQEGCNGTSAQRPSGQFIIDQSGLDKEDIRDRQFSRDIFARIKVG